MRSAAIPAILLALALAGCGEQTSSDTTGSTDARGRASSQQPHVQGSEPVERDQSPTSSTGGEIPGYDPAAQD